MIRPSYLEELQNLSFPLKIYDIHMWLIKYEKRFLNVINSTSCGKWHRWFINKEQPFPCCCPIRETECLFVELYYELAKVIKGECNSEYITFDVIELVLITQNEPYERIKFLIKLKT